ncbi:hypothetical protein Thein_1511 [Thermodesulfatator indicus DSM 15286]|uniref:Uncharacterized protein n=1 Tax=Thermodesulfatator indicus (strain DSM 15286 / JCM 11887 / CIR29812) TaxID=667014 RepID=F8AAF2_THEID|nr:hypothetical protein [Thermodesulfatator indicus]AEH45372.1 hypothetical protein Thein_1511 [Thermodesulfatator indicus DSM 15286]
MLRRKLDTLEKKVESLSIAEENYPSKIVVNLLSCNHPNKKERLLSHAESAAEIVIRAGCGGDEKDCKNCPYYAFQGVNRLRFG